MSSDEAQPEVEAGTLTSAQLLGIDDRQEDAVLAAYGIGYAQGQRDARDRPVGAEAELAAHTALVTALDRLHVDWFEEVAYGADTVIAALAKKGYEITPAVTASPTDKQAEPPLLDDPAPLPPPTYSFGSRRCCDGSPTTPEEG